ncbi:MAG: hypothetical protein ACHQQQ_10380 [Bacteroidota bacterium]
MPYMLIRKLLLVGIAAVALNGCAMHGTLFEKSAIHQKPYLKWTEDECRIVMEGYVSSNILDRAAPLSVVAIPCTPNFLLAYNCLKWKKHLCSTDEFYENTDRQARQCFGGSFESRTGKFLSGKGSYILDVSQFDSILIVIDIENANDLKTLASMCFQNYMEGSIGSSSFLDLFPDISDMKDKITFRADKEILARPEWVRCGDATFLMQEEQYDAMFYIDVKFKQYIREHGEADLYFTVAEHPVSVSVKFSI